MLCSGSPKENGCASSKLPSDIYVTRLEQQQWTTPVHVHADDWVINACPDNGPALDPRDHTGGHRLVDDGRRCAERQSRVLNRRGQSWRPPVRVD